jgi:orotate phosphoribosyltransferase
MHLIPTKEELLDLLRRTGGLRTGHFEYPGGLHSNEYIQVALTMRYFEEAKTLSVALSRLLRSHSDIRAMIPELSIVAPAGGGGIPVAYGVSEALHARQVYWAERDCDEDPLRLRQFFEVEPGEKVFLVDDIVRRGTRLTELKKMIESMGGEVVGMAVVVYDPLPEVLSFDPLPFYHLLELRSTYYPDAASCELCKKGEPVTKVRV